MKKSLSDQEGFSLLEMTAVLIIMSVLLSAVVPVMSRAFLEKAAQKAAQDMAEIQIASQKYFKDNNQWPKDLAALQSGNEPYLPPGWDLQNPFTHYEPDLQDFSYHIQTVGSALQVYTNIPTDAQGIMKNMLPLVYTVASGSGLQIFSSITASGGTDSLPTGVVMAWSGPSVPEGFLACDGSVYNVVDYPALAAVLKDTFGGDGITTFAVPNLQGQAIFGVNASDGSFVLGKSGGSKNLVVPYIYHISGRGGGVTYGVDSEPVDDNSGGTDFSEHNLVNVPVTGTVDHGTSLPPYLTLNYIIKA